MDIEEHNLNKLLNFEQICRTCLSEGEMNPIFNGSSLEVIIYEVLTFCQLKISKDDGLPNQICLKCQQETERVYQFIELCKQSEQILHNYHLQLQGTQDVTHSDKLLKTEFHEDEIVLNNTSIEHSYCSGEENHSTVNEFKKEEEELHEESSPDRNPARTKRVVKSKFKSKFNKKGSRRKKKCRNDDLDDYVLEPDVYYTDRSDSNSEETVTDIPKIKQEENNITENNSKKHKNKIITCKDCGEICENSISYREHRKKHLKKIKTVGPFKCNHCDKEFKFRKNLWQHERSHGEKKYLCNYCGRAFLILSNLNQHVRMHTGEKPFSCTICNKTFGRLANLKQHKLIHTGEKPHQCPVCNKRFTQLPHLIVHKRMHSGDRPYKCTLCPKGFATRAGLRKHHRTHTGEKPFECEQCDKKFSLVQGLRKHMIAAHTIEGQEAAAKKINAPRKKTLEKKYLCNICGKKLATPPSLITHYKIHSNERPFSCELCEKSFKHAPTLKVHMLTHTGEKPYECEVCKKKFTQRNHLAYHSRVHSGEKPYVCTVCGKAFALNGNLTVHMRIHTGETPYHCPVCGKGFYDSSSMKKHQKGHAEKDEKM